MKAINILLITILCILILNSCGFNHKDENAWKEKLCEGFWEDNSSIISTYNKNKVEVKWKFNNNGSFEFDESGGVSKHVEGTWSIKNYDTPDEDKRMIVVHFNNDLWGYSQFALGMDYGRDKKFLIDFYDQNSNISFKFHHYSDGIKLID